EHLTPLKHRVSSIFALYSSSVVAKSQFPVRRLHGTWPIRGDALVDHCCRFIWRSRGRVHRIEDASAPLLVANVSAVKPNSCRLNKIVQRCRVVDENAMAGRLARRPLSEQVEQHSVVWLVCFVRVRPVAPPYHPLWRGLHICLTDLVHIGVSGWTVLCIVICHRQLDPGSALIDQSANESEGRVFHAHRLGDVAHMI